MTEKEMYQLIMSLKSQISTRTCDFAGKHIFQAGKGDEIHLMMKGKESTKISDIMQIHEPVSRLLETSQTAHQRFSLEIQFSKLL